jgi:excisionase family DNA binding protein
MTVVSLSAYGLLTVPEAASLRGVSERTVQRWVETDGIPVVLLGTDRNRVYLIPAKELGTYEPRKPGAPEGNQYAKKKPRKKSRNR